MKTPKRQFLSLILHFQICVDKKQTKREFTRNLLGQWVACYGSPGPP